MIDRRSDAPLRHSVVGSALRDRLQQSATARDPVAAIDLWGRRGLGRLRVQPRCREITMTAITASSSEAAANSASRKRVRLCGAVIEEGAGEASGWIAGKPSALGRTASPTEGQDAGPAPLIVLMRATTHITANASARTLSPCARFWLMPMDGSSSLRER